MSRTTVLRGSLLLAAFVAPLVAYSAISAQSKTAVVVGTSQLFIRRGPGTEFPPFATLTGGSQVHVQELHGQWARVATASGQVGYVHVKFLRMVEEEPEPTPAATPAVAFVREATTPARSAPPVARQAELAGEQLAPATPPAPAMASPALATPAAAPSRSSEGNMEAEMRRLANAVEALGRKFDQRLPVPESSGAMTASEPTSSVSGGAILLGLAGVIVGWVLGATYQRNKERGRRSRIRL